MEETVSAADANRHFSRILRSVRGGRRVVVTSHGKPIAQILPIEEDDHLAQGARSALLNRLRSESIVSIGRWSRNELYEG